MTVRKHYFDITSTYEPIKLYSRVAGVWQQTHETHLTISPEYRGVGLVFDGSTAMEQFTGYLYHSHATYSVIYRPDARGVWTEVGRIISPAVTNS